MLGDAAILETRAEWRLYETEQVMNTRSRKQRALVIMGAGASVEFGIPITAKFGNLIDAAVTADRFCVAEGGAAAYLDIRDKLRTYYGVPEEAHFERIYHVLHELSELRVTPGAVSRFRPVMSPFLGEAVSYTDRALKAARRAVLEVIYKTVTQACDKPAVPLKPMSDFFEALETRYLPRVYTTNYDDFVGQATNKRYFTGFTERQGDHAYFNAGTFWSEWDQPGLFHTHGSIHMGFPPGGKDIGDIGWFEDKAAALTHATFFGSGVWRMDGTSIERGAIITGLDKLGRLQQTPYAHYYAGLCRDAMEADLILVLGSGLADLHFNSILKAARRNKPNVPILYVGYWGNEPNDFYNKVQFEHEDRDIALLHDLDIDLIRVRETQYRAHSGWTIASNRRAAVWADGFQKSLANPQMFIELAEKLSVRGRGPSVARTPKLWREFGLVWWSKFLGCLNKFASIVRHRR